MRLIRTTPALPVRDIRTAVVFYRDKLGFAVGHHDESFAIVTRDDAEIHLWAASDEAWPARLENAPSRPIVSGAESFLAGTASCRIEVHGIDDLYEEYQAAGVLYGSDTVVEQTPWSTREFPALDLQRNLLTFYQRL